MVNTRAIVILCMIPPVLGNAFLNHQGNPVAAGDKNQRDDGHDPENNPSAFSRLRYGAGGAWLAAPNWPVDLPARPTQ